MNWHLLLLACALPSLTLPAKPIDATTVDPKTGASTPFDPLRRLGDPDFRTRERALDLLRDAGPTAERVRTLVAQIGSPDEHLRFNSLSALLFGGWCLYLTRKDLPAVYAAVKTGVGRSERKPYVNMGTAHSLIPALLLQPSHVQEIVRDLDAKDTGTRLAAAHVLATMKYTPAVPKLIALFRRADRIGMRELNFALYHATEKSFENDPRKWEKWLSQEGKSLPVPYRWQAHPPFARPALGNVKIPGTVAEISAILRPGMTNLRFAQDPDWMEWLSYDKAYCRRGLSEYTGPGGPFVLDVLGVEEIHGRVMVRVNPIKAASLCQKDFAAAKASVRTPVQYQGMYVPFLGDDGRPNLWPGATDCRAR